MIDYVKKIAPGRYNKEITEMFNKKFGLNKTVGQINSMKGNHGIRSNIPRNMPRPHARLLTPEQDKFLRKNVKGLYNQELADLMNGRFGLNLTAQQINTYKSNRGLSSGLTGRFEKGHTTWNKGKKGWIAPGSEKTWFKKGREPLNYRPVGSERICSKDGYVMVKTGEPDVWELKHRLVWEKHRGKIPKDHIVSFYDGDKTNLSLDNLFLCTRAENIRMHQSNLYSSNPALTKIGLAIVRLDTKIREKERGYTDTEIRVLTKEAEKNGISYSTFQGRLKRGWTVEDAVNKPLHYVPKRRRS